MRKGLSYLAYGAAVGVLLVGASHDALRAAASGANEKLAVFSEVFNKAVSYTHLTLPTNREV